VLNAGLAGLYNQPVIQRRSLYAFILAVAVACPAAAQVATAPARAEEQVAVAPGVLYRHVKQSTAQGEPWSVHVLEVSRNSGLDLRAVAGQNADGQMQRNNPTAMAAREANNGARVLAAVNGDYDSGGQGISLGLSVTSSRFWTSAKSGWPVLAFRHNGEPLIAEAQQAIKVRVKRKDVLVSAINKPVEAGLRLYTREYPAAVKSAKPLKIVMVSRLSPALPLAVNSTVEGRIESIIGGASEVSIGPDAYALVVGEDDPAARQLARWRKGDKVSLKMQVSVEGHSDIRHVIGGFPILVRGGRRDIVGEPAASLSKRHPRTAACYNREKVIFTVVDGRQPDLSVGMTLEELADLMVSLGCEVAMNTDGGGSSVMAITYPGTNGVRIVNSPSDGKERGRGNAFLVVQGGQP